MQVLRLERVAVTVAPEAKRRLMGLFDMRWWTGRVQQAPGADGLSLSIADAGLELIDGDAQAMRSFHLRVADLDETREELARFGYQVSAEFTVGQMRHLVASMEGLRIVFVAYEGDALEALSAAPRRRSSNSA